MSPVDEMEKTTTLTSAEVVQITKDTNYGTWRFQKGWNPMHIVDAEGCYITDANGKKYLDFSSQLMCMNLGHKNRSVVDAIKQQAEELAYAMPGYATTARAELSKLLLELLPKGLDKFFFTTSGTDANEAAFKIARMYTGKTKIYCGFDCGDRRSPALGDGAARQRAGHHLWAGGALLQVPHQAHLPGVRDCMCGLSGAHDPQ